MYSFQQMQERLQAHMPALDGLRGLAILYVVFHNVATHGLDEPASLILKLYSLLADSGWMGVQLFFVLSGFLITGILLQSKGQPHYFRNFYMRRTLRIFPVYYVSLFLLFTIPAMAAWNAPWLEHSSQYSVWYWTYTINWVQPFDRQIELGHFWSLAIEEQFYLLWPLLVLGLGRKQLAYLCVFLILSAFAGRWIFNALNPELAVNAAYTMTVFRWDGLAFGALLAIVLRDQRAYLLLCRYWRAAVILALAFIVLSLYFTHQFSPIAKSADSLAVMNLSMISLLFFALMFYLLAAEEGSRLKRWISMAWLRFFGKYSYAMYLFHIPLEYLWFSWFSFSLNAQQAWTSLFVLFVNFLGVLMVSTLLAILSWRLLEQPLLRLKTRYNS